MINECREQLNKNGIYLLKPKGNSMLPFIKGKTEVVVINKEERLNVLDVGLYERGDGTLVLHRVIEVLENGYVFTGDSTVDTEVIEEDAVFALMIAYKKGKKTVDVSSKRYQDKIKKHYQNQEKRLKYIKRLNRKLKFKGAIYSAFIKKDK